MLSQEREQEKGRFPSFVGREINTLNQSLVE